MEELRLPKCLTEKERRGILEYNETILDNFAPNEREGMRREIFMPRDDKWIYCPFEEYSPWGSNMPLKFEENHMNKALDEALQKILTQKSGGYEKGDLLLFFNRAYAIANHILNHGDSVYTLKRYLAIWDTPTDTRLLTQLWGIYFSQIPTPLCKYICASMVFCILDHEDENRPEQLLQEIEWLLQTSQDGKDTLKVFQEKVAAANEQTEENTQGEEQPLEKKEEEATRTDATKDVCPPNTALLQFKEEGGIEKWAGLVNEAIKDIEDHTLTSSLSNTMLAVMYYFARGWLNRKGIFKKKPNVKQIVYFFLSRCAFNSAVCEKTLVNKLNELLKGDKEIVETDETEQVKENIQKILAKNS